MRRIIIFAIVVSRAALASTPVPACGLFSSPVAECDAAQSQMQCDGMDMQMNVHDDVPHLSPPCQNTCCITNQVFRPEVQNKSDETLVLVARVSGNAGANILFIPNESIPAFHWHEISPRRIQSLLCTFLI